mgnify:FL=1
MIAHAARSNRHEESNESKNLIAQMASTPLLGLEREKELAHELIRLRGLIAYYRKAIAESESGSESELYHVMLANAESELTRKRDEFFYANIRLVLDIVKDMSRMEYMDMFQMGGMGLMRAVDLFDPTMDVRFSTYASFWIKQAIQRGCDKDESLIALPVHVRDMLKFLRRVSIAFVQRYNATPTLQQVCEYANLDYAKVLKIKTIAELPVSLDKTFETTLLFNDFELLDFSEDETPSTLDLIIREEERQAKVALVHACLDQLAAVEDDEGGHPFERHAQVIRLRYRIGEETPCVNPLLDVKIPRQRTLEEVGLLMVSEESPEGITRERARQLQRAGFRWLVENCTELQELRET